MPELAFFVGKGGVGKTTASAAYAVHSAIQDPSRRVLLLSTDPAHSLADILEVRLHDTTKPIPLPDRGKLDAWHVNAEKLFRDFLDRYKEKILAIVDAGAIFSREDIGPLLDSTLPGMAEVSALLAVRDALMSGKYARIVVDTAPFGHTLRLFQLPEHFLRFLNFLELAASRDRILAEHFGGRGRGLGEQFLNDWREMGEGVQEAFTKKAKVFLVTTPEKFSLNESVRCSAALKSFSPPVQVGAVVLNRAVPGSPRCLLCQERAKATRAARSFLHKQFPETDIYIGEDLGVPILGARNLNLFAEHVFSGGPLKVDFPAAQSGEVRLKSTRWPVLETPLSLVVGKGGVGKTTVSAALGYNTRSKSKAPVEICSVDPAPSLDDVFQKEIDDRSEPVLGDPEFRASEMDSQALFKQWVGEIRSSIEAATTTEISGIHIDLSFERQMLSELLDIVPPGVDEVLAIFRILDLLSHGSKKVVIDMAPTGHALELLRMPERILGWTRPLLKTMAAHRTLALARDAGVQIAEMGQRVRELAGVLKDPKRACIHTVMLAEPLPDRETERLINDLRKLRLPAKSIFLNRVLFAEDVGKCRRCGRAMQWQRATMSALQQRYPRLSIYVVRNFPKEIAGRAGLRSFTGELWRIA
ncbi:MAG TPA: ArsA family ATPase [Terriglobales bacterium]|nr:ArsA family ATPase [Terriglobales bacterium]